MHKTAFVTGGGTGIGKAIALKLVEAGYDIAVHCNSSISGAEDVLKTADKYGRKCKILQYDISSVDNIREMFKIYSEAFDTLDLFVNNAGVTAKSVFIDTTEEQFDTIANVDFKGAFFCMQEAARIMIRTENKGSIILISSNNAFTHFADVSVYGPVKAAANKLTEHIAIELAKYGIRVNSIAPGWTDTGASRLDAKESTYYKIPLKKWVDADEIADSVIFLASDSARSITGATLIMDNGAKLVCDSRDKYGF